MTQLLGYIGSIIILVAFAYVTKGKWSPQGKKYLSANLIGALFLAIYQISLGAFAGVLLNVVFFVFASYGLAKYWRTK